MPTSILDVHQLKQLRPLGAIEQFSSARHHLGFYHNVGVSASYHHTSQDPIALKLAIFSALAAVINCHSILSAIPVDEGSTNPYFARLPSINLEEVVTFLTRRSLWTEDQCERDDELDAILQVQHNTSFKARYGELPFWRLIILTNPSVESRSEFMASFIFHHSLGDGGSGMTFHRDFLSALNSNLAPLRSFIVLPPNTELLPSLETALPLSLCPATPQPHLPGLWSGAKISFPMTSNFRSLTIPASTSAVFINACRTHNTTVTATIPVLIASALSKLLPEQYTDFEACIPVNLRRWLPTPLNNNDNMGVFIDAFSEYYQRTNFSSGFSWSEARRSREMIGEYLKTGGEKVNVSRLGMVPDMRKFFLSKVGTYRGSSFDISNLGGLPAGKDGNVWKMGRMVFSRSAFVTGSAFSTGLVTGQDGRLVFGFCWQEGIVDSEFINGLIERVRSEIACLACEK